MANGGLILDYLVIGVGAPSAYSFPGGSIGVPSLGDNTTETAHYLNKTNNHLYVWDGSAWQDVTGAGGTGALTQLAQIVGSGQATMDFTSIAGTYSSLRAEWTLGSSAATGQVDLNCLINNDSAANYDKNEQAATSNQAFFSGALAASTMNMDSCVPGTSQANFAGSGAMIIPGYARTTFYKQVLTDIFAPAGSLVTNRFRRTIDFTWHNTAAITRLTFSLSSGNFAVGSAITLYGLS